MDQWTPKTEAAVISLWFLPWPNLCSLLNYTITKFPNTSQYVIAAQFVINLGKSMGGFLCLFSANHRLACFFVVSGVGAGSASIAAGLINSSLPAVELHPRKIEMVTEDESKDVI
jgi:hypothetical protein